MVLMLLILETNPYFKKQVSINKKSGKYNLQKTYRSTDIYIIIILTRNCVVFKKILLK